MNLGHQNRNFTNKDLDYELITQDKIFAGFGEMQVAIKLIVFATSKEQNAAPIKDSIVSNEFIIQESCRKSFVLSRLTAFMTALYYRVVRLNDEYFPGLKLIDCQLRLRFDRVLVFLPVKIILDWLFILMFNTKVNSEPNLPIF